MEDEGTATGGRPTPAVIDAHTHVACPDTERFPTRPTGVGSDWWAHGGGAVEGLVAEMDAAGVIRAVAVQAVGVYGHDCRCAAHAVAAHPDRLALVASVDMDGSDPAQALHDLVGESGSVRPAGVRCFGVGAKGATWLDDGRGHEVWATAGDLGLTVVPCVFSPALDAVAGLSAAHPEVRVAVDHCGFPDREGAAGWAAVHRLAEVGSVALKVSSYVLEAAERDDGDPAPVVDDLARRFGAHRLCWGSDHPQDQTRSYADKLALAAHAVRRLDGEAVASFFHHTAARLWWGRP
ncbi:amidohydrolase family protein [Rhabdothermincola salaria]|uniref:amidohydrolase family protein n=1 Tax=Rhabdothermincola salaria TaxID=2903142 RepID=UPI001E4A89F9|nr:amidohydrolase family protein [Rhabdothermincola salaria]